MMTRTKEQISHNMSLIKGKDTKPELLLRHALFKKGLRYRKNYSGLVGHPDIVFLKDRLVVFVDGDFWHGRDWEKQEQTLKSHREYWIKKIERNISNDRKITSELEAQGYAVMRFWEKEIEHDLPRCVDIISESLRKTRNPYGRDE